MSRPRLLSSLRRKGPIFTWMRSVSCGDSDTGAAYCGSFFLCTRLTVCGHFFIRRKRTSCGICSWKAVLRFFETYTASDGAAADNGAVDKIIAGDMPTNNVIHGVFQFVESEEKNYVYVTSQFEPITVFAKDVLLEWLSRRDWKDLLASYVKASKRTQAPALFEALCHSFFVCSDMTSTRRSLYMRDHDKNTGTSYAGASWLDLPIVLPCSKRCVTVSSFAPI